MSSNHFMGPALPPAFRKDNDEDSGSDNDFAGPALPPGYKRADLSSSSDSESEVNVKRAKTGHTSEDGLQGLENSKPLDDDDGFFGPALPPGFKKKQSSPERPPVLGPALPPGFCRAAHDSDDGGEDAGDVPRPALPPGYQADPSSSEDEDVVGPMPAKGPVQDTVTLDIERRAKQMKDKLTGEDAPEVVTRETWMTELPPELQHIGLGARSFKRRSGPEKGDRSIWTDTPADREQKTRERLEAKEKGQVEKESPPQASRKDLEMVEKLAKYNESTRPESLMSLHAKKMKEQAKQEGDKPAERRPFDRDADLQVNRFDDAQKQRLLKKSQDLNSRFSHSKDRMFL